MSKFKLVGLPGIEPGLHAPEACVIPLYHSPFVDLRGLEPLTSAMRMQRSTR